MSGQQGPGDGGAIDAPEAAEPVEDGSLDTPNCPNCLTRMEAASTATGGVYWACEVCGQTRLA